MILYKNKQIKIPELITILTLSVGLWVYMYEKIIDISSRDIYSDVVLSLSFSHALIFFNLAFTLILLYNKTRGRLNSRMFIASNRISSYLSNLWFPTTVYCLVNYLFFYINTYTKFDYALLVNGSLSLLVTLFIFAFFYQIPLIGLIRKNRKDFLIWRFLIAFSYYVYLPVMVIMSSDIEVTFNKEVYKDEDIDFKLTKRGYIFLPHITTIRVGGVKEFNVYDLSYSLDKSLIKSNDNYLEVIYEPQVFRIARKKIVHLPFIKK